MHITYDLPVSIDDILEAKQRLAGKIYKTGMPRSNYFSGHRHPPQAGRSGRIWKTSGLPGRNIS